MAGQNRSSYARSNSSANRGFAAFLRGAFILLVALVLSFGLGFFVIARMVPSGVSDLAGSSRNGAGNSGEASGPAPTDHRSQHTNSTQSTPQVATKPPQPGSPPADGPVILPDTDVQKPTSLESTGTNPNSSGSDAPDPSDPKTQGEKRSDNGAAISTGTNPAAGDQTTDTPGQRRSRRSRTSGEDAGAVQQAASPDSTSSQANDSTRSTTDAAPAKSGIYRVQIGVYSTREKAEEVARSAADKGIATTLHVINRDGRTLYRVQQSTHRDRTKAELDRQKLIDAGFDATIINP